MSVTHSLEQLMCLWNLDVTVLVLRNSGKFLQKKFHILDILEGLLYVKKCFDLFKVHVSIYSVFLMQFEQNVV